MPFAKGVKWLFQLSDFIHHRATDVLLTLIAEVLA
jgi:hypothetical protein